MSNTLPITVGWATDPGRVHPVNEDSYAIFAAPHGVVLVVCDGMGGMGRGDEASQLAVRAIYQYLRDAVVEPDRAIAEALQSADYAIRRKLCSSGKVRPGATGAITYVTKSGFHVGWIGDSPTYHLRGPAVLARTRDDKLVEDLVDQGELTPEEAANSPLSSVLTKALGGRPPSPQRVESSAVPAAWVLEQDDCVVLCSDGLTDLVTGEEIAAVTKQQSPTDAVHELVRMANSRGGHDNITVIIAQHRGETTFDAEGISNAEIGPWVEEINDHATDPHGLTLRHTMPPDSDQALDNRTFEFAPPRDLNPNLPTRNPEQAGWVALIVGAVLLTAIVIGSSLA